MGPDRGVEGRGGDPLILGQQVVGPLVEQGNPADEGGTGDEVIAVGQELLEQGEVLGIPHDPAVARVVVVAAPHRAVLREVVQADDLGADGQQLFDEITGDEAGRTGDQNTHSSNVLLPAA